LRLIFYLYNGSQSQFEQGRNENCWWSCLNLSAQNIIYRK
jgi:hypothetical protein